VRQTRRICSAATRLSTYLYEVLWHDLNGEEHSEAWLSTGDRHDWTAGTSPVGEKGAVAGVNHGAWVDGVREAGRTGTARRRQLRCPSAHDR